MWPGEGDLVLCVFEDNVFDPAAREKIEWRCGKRRLFIAGIQILQETVSAGIKGSQFRRFKGTSWGKLSARDTLRVSSWRETSCGSPGRRPITPSVTLPAPSTGARQVENVQLAACSRPSGEINCRTFGIVALFAVAGDVSEVSETIGRDRET